MHPVIGVQMGSARVSRAAAGVLARRNGRDILRDHDFFEMRPLPITPQISRCIALTLALLSFNLAVVSHLLFCTGTLAFRIQRSDVARSSAAFDA
jgi:hypothetical protein